MSERVFFPGHGNSLPGRVTMRGKLVTTTGGTIDTTKSEFEGFTVVKTGTKTGRYTITLHRAYKRLGGMAVTIIGTDDAAATGTNGWIYQLRKNTISTDGAFFLQFKRSDTNADAELEDAAEVRFEIIAYRK